MRLGHGVVEVARCCICGRPPCAPHGGHLRLAPSFDGGGFTGYGARSGGVDGMGGIPAIVHPNETIVDHSKGQSLGGGAVDVRVFMDENGNWQAAVERISGKVSARMVAGNARQQQDRQYLRNGR